MSVDVYQTTILRANRLDPDQTPRSAAFDLDLTICSDCLSEYLG